MSPIRSYFMISMISYSLKENWFGFKFTQKRVFLILHDYTVCNILTHFLIHTYNKYITAVQYNNN